MDKWRRQKSCCPVSQFRLIQGRFESLDELTLIGKNGAMTSITALDFKKRRDLKVSFTTLRNVSMHALSMISFMTHCAAVITAALSYRTLRLADVISITS